MSAIEIVLLLAGGIIFILSFLLPVSRQEVSGETKEAAEEEIKKLISQEMDGVKGHVEDVVDEAVEYAMEKTERSLERLSNEKIMAVSEYSDTVMQEIHKNHEEVMFLYDMLNNKHANLKNTVSQVNKTVKAVEETTREAEAAMNSFKQLQPEVVTDKILQPRKPAEEKTPERSEEKPTAARKAASKEEAAVSQNSRKNGSMDLSFTGGQKNSDSGTNSNEQILKLHRQGKSTVAIAKELGLGVGEVKLVIGLYKNL